MQSLDLSGSARKSDGWLKSLLWPTVDNAWDVDYLGQQGFWICLLIAVVSLVFLSGFAPYQQPAAHRVGLILAITTFFVFFVGGMGVRQASWPAAAMVFAVYAVNQVAGGRVGILAIIFGAVLLSNLRATYLASRWTPPAEDEDRPMRFNETWRDKLVDQLPPRAWPILRIPFYVAASLLLLFTLYASALTLSRPAVSSDSGDETPGGDHSALVLPRPAAGVNACPLAVTGSERPCAAGSRAGRFPPRPRSRQARGTRFRTAGFQRACEWRPPLPGTR